MQISIRNAKKLQNELQKHNDDITVDKTVLLYEDSVGTVAEEVDERKQQALQAIAAKHKLTETTYAIRVLVAEAQANARTSTLLTKAAELEAKAATIAEIATVAAYNKQPNLRLVEAKFEKASKNDAADEYASHNVGLFTEEEINAYNSQVLSLRRKADKLKDEVQELNFTTQITLPQAVVEVCEALDLV